MVTGSNSTSPQLLPPTSPVSWPICILHATYLIVLNVSRMGIQGGMNKLAMPKRALQVPGSHDCSPRSNCHFTRNNRHKRATSVLATLRSCCCSMKTAKADVACCGRCHKVQPAAAAVAMVQGDSPAYLNVLSLLTTACAGTPTYKLS